MVFVAGEPALLLGAREAAWRQALRDAGVTGLVHPRLRFVVGGWRRGGNVFDLDNLVDPVIGIVAAPVRELQSLWATVEIGSTPGVSIGEERPPDAQRVAVSELPRCSTRHAAPLLGLAVAAPLPGDGPVGCELRLLASDGEIRFGFEGVVKPTIDGLWPILGGSPHDPHDHRIHDLRIVRSEGPASTVAVWALR